jgi:hypothetical protein
MTGPQPGRLSGICIFMPDSFPFIIYFHGTGTRLTTIPLTITMLATTFLIHSNNPAKKKRMLFFFREENIVMITLRQKG